VSNKSNRNVSLSAFKSVNGKRHGTEYRTDQALAQRMARPNSRRTQRQGRKSILFRYLPHLPHYLRCRHFFCQRVSGRKSRFSHQECSFRRVGLMNKRVLPIVVIHNATDETLRWVAGRTCEQDLRSGARCFSVSVALLVICFCLFLLQPEVVVSQLLGSQV
jgi:hypothetical protein